MEQYDYTSELIEKWTRLGHLTGVREEDITRVAQRLEAAFRRTMGQHGDPDAIGKEMISLQREGYFPRPEPVKQQQHPQRRRRRQRSSQRSVFIEQHR